jgi:hypothetical protein
MQMDELQFVAVEVGECLSIIYTERFSDWEKRKFTYFRESFLEWQSTE